MPVIAIDTSPRLSNWLKYEYDPSSGVTLEALQKSAVNATVSGSVLDSTGALVVHATIADATYIMIDDLTRPSASQYSQVLVLARGYAKVAPAALTFGSDVTSGDITAIMTHLALKNIFAVTQI